MLQASLSKVRFATLFVAAVLGSWPAAAQFNSAIEGAVSDQSGSAIPDAKVLLTNRKTGVELQTRATSTGYYQFPSLPPGDYKITASHPGFQTVVRENITLTAQRVQSVPVSLGLSSLTSEITVTAEPPPIQLSQPQIGANITNGQVNDLPMQGRNVLQAAAQAPGVVGEGLMGNSGADVFNATTFVAIAANGQANSGNLYFLDGTGTMDSPSGGGTKLVPNPESVAEMVVSVNNYSARYGKGSGAVTEIVTKSGTNDYHGSLFEYHQDNVLTARTFLQNSKNPLTGRVLPVFRRNEFGGSLGGRVLKDRTFFFFSWDQVRASNANAGLTTLETPQFVNFMKANYPNNISTQLLTRFPTSVSQIQPGTLQRVASFVPNCSGTGGPLKMPCDLPVLGQGINSFTIPRNGHQWNLRIDQYFKNDRVYGNYYDTPLLAGGNNVRPAFSQDVPQYARFASINWTHTFTPTLLNEAAYGISRTHADIPCKECYVPGIGVVGLPGFGTGFAPAMFSQNDFHWRDMLSWTRGKHSLKAGIESFHNQDNAPFTPTFIRPGFTFQSVLDFAADKPAFENLNFDPRTGGTGNNDRYYHSTNIGVFVQDDLRLSSRLTLSPGLRWDFNTSPTEAHNQVSVIKLGAGSTFQDRIAGASLQTANNFIANNPIAYFAPRLGLAWDPFGTGKTSVRAGFGIFFNRGGNDVWSDTSRNNPPIFASINLSIFDAAGPKPLFALCDPNSPFTCAKPALPAGLNPRNGPAAGLAGIGGPDQGLKQAYAENWFFGIQHSLTAGWVIEADYLGSAGRHLYSIIDRNRYAGDRVLHDGLVTRLNPYFSSINYADNSGSSSFHGGTVAVTKRLRRGLSLQSAFTFTKTIDFMSAAPGQNKGHENAAVVDAYNLQAQRGLSNADIPRKLSFNFVYEIPTVTSKSGILKTVTQGWKLSSLGILQSGAPASVFSSTGDYNGDGYFYDFPNAPTKGAVKSSPSRSDYINGTIFRVSDFPVPVFGTEGNLGRNTFRGPGMAQVDMNLQKDTHIPWFRPEGAKLQFRSEFYNVLNRVNPINWDTNLSRGTFGKVTGSRQARTLQLAVRVDF